MKTFINHPTYGQIVYEEAFWTSKKTLQVNGKYLTKIDKSNFILNDGEQKKCFSVRGNLLFGAYATVGREKIELTPPLKWYEILLNILFFTFFLIWSNNVNLVSIFPLVGGAIGGIIVALGMFLSILASKPIKSIPLKLLVWLGGILLTILVNFLVAIFIISALASSSGEYADARCT